MSSWTIWRTEAAWMDRLVARGILRLAFAFVRFMVRMVAVVIACASRINCSGRCPPTLRKWRQQSPFDLIVVCRWQDWTLRSCSVVRSDERI